MSNYLKGNVHNISYGKAVRELCSIRDGSQSLSGFTKSDIIELIDDISTSVINKSEYICRLHPMKSNVILLTLV